MSRENIETIKWAYDVVYAQRSVTEVMDRFADNFVWHNRPEWPGKTTYRAAEMPELWADLDETYSEFELNPADFEEIGDEYVLVRVEQSARLRNSDARVESTIWHLWRIEGKPTEGRVFSDPTQARRAAEPPE